MAPKDMEKIKVVYQAYGKPEILRQVFFSLASLQAALGEEKDQVVVHIFTDDEKAIRAFVGDDSRVVITQFSPEELRVWRGAIDFVHRVKLEILKRAFRDWEKSLVYLDGDTVFLGNPLPLFSKISAKTSLMHVMESALGKPKDPLTRKIGRFVKKKKFSLQGTRIEIFPETEMWNAGVIGLSSANKNFFEQMIELTDELYRAYPKHVMEQLAVSWLLQQKTNVLPADDVVLHYWNQKQDYDQAIQGYLSLHPDLAQARAGYSKFVRPAPKTPKISVSRKILNRFKQALWPANVSN